MPFVLITFTGILQIFENFNCKILVEITSVKWQRLLIEITSYSLINRLIKYQNKVDKSFLIIMGFKLCDPTDVKKYFVQ